MSMLVLSLKAWSHVVTSSPLCLKTLARNKIDTRQTTDNDNDETGVDIVVGRAYVSALEKRG
jgi:hypothetical protein